MPRQCWQKSCNHSGRSSDRVASVKAHAQGTKLCGSGPSNWSQRHRGTQGKATQLGPSAALGHRRTQPRKTPKGLGLRILPWRNFSQLAVNVYYEKHTQTHPVCQMASQTPQWQWLGQTKAQSKAPVLVSQILEPLLASSNCTYTRGELELAM